MVEQIEWDEGRFPYEKSHIQSCRYASKNKDFILAAGSNANVAKLISLQTMKISKSFTEFKKACLTVDVSHDGEMCVIGSGDGTLSLKKLLYKWNIIVISNITGIIILLQSNGNYQEFNF